MQGKILEFSIDNNTGVISGEDGNRYGFQGGEVHSDVPPRAGDNVDFQATGDQATGIYKVADMMAHSTRKAYPVTHNGKVVGLITRSQILRALNDYLMSCSLPSNQ